LIAGIHTEVWLAGGYAVFLAVTAACLELLARHSHRRSGQFRTVGFKFRRELDLWECPTGQHLRRSQVDRQRRIVRYRAPAHACNACHSKSDCTDSDDGREIEHHLDSWLDSEVRRFHRGISLALLLLAAIILIAEALRYNRSRDLFVLAGLVLPVGAAGLRLLAGFRTREAPARSPGK
jgi:hypothetical protein